MFQIIGQANILQNYNFRVYDVINDDYQLTMNNDYHAAYIHATRQQKMHTKVQ
jgi:hypothetical protein